MNTNCGWFWKVHKWTKWEVIETGNIITHVDALGLPIQPSDKPRTVGVYEYQRRVCEVCGASQLRYVSA